MAAVLVHIDLDGAAPQTLHPASRIALAAGRQLASSWGATLYASVILHTKPGATPVGVGAIETAVSRCGADKLVVGLTDGPVTPMWSSVGTVWQGVLDHVRPRLVLFGADAPSAIELAPRTGARIGARLLTRARTLGGDGAQSEGQREIELRDRDGGYVRIGDSGAAVALVGRAEVMPSGKHADDIDVIVLEFENAADKSIELGAIEEADLAVSTLPIVALADDVVGNAKLVADAQKLAAMLDGALVGGAAVKSIAGARVVPKATALAPELCIAIGSSKLEVAGATSVIKIGSADKAADKTADGTLPAPPDISLASLVKHLEEL